MPPTSPGAPRPDRPRPSAGARIRDGARTLNPGYFALVMATGIVSIAMANHRAYALSVALAAWCVTFLAMLAHLARVLPRVERRVGIPR